VTCVGETETITCSQVDARLVDGRVDLTLEKRALNMVNFSMWAKVKLAWFAMGHSCDIIKQL